MTSGITASRGYAYGMKVHNRFVEAKGNGVDKETGLIHYVEANDANVYEITQAESMLNR